MPTYKNNTDVTLYVPEEVKPGATRSFTHYKHGTSLTLVDENHLNMVMASGATTLASGGTVTETLSINTDLDFSVVCDSGSLEIYFNADSFSPVRLTKGLVYNNQFNTKAFRKMIIKATADNTKIYYAFVRV